MDLSARWGFRLYRAFGVTVRIHWILLLYLVYMLLIGPRIHESWLPFHLRAINLALIFGIVLLHEYGHVFMARAVGGGADEIVLWPLGGLAMCSTPNRALPNFLVAAAGPAVNLLLFFAGVVALASFRVPVFVAEGTTWAVTDGGFLDHLLLRWPAVLGDPQWSRWWMLLWFANWINIVLFLFNLMPVYPLDGGRIFSSALWPFVGEQRAHITAAKIGMVAAVGLFFYALYRGDVLLALVAVFVFFSARHEVRVRSQMMPDLPFGYDFSGGYTTLERGGGPGILERWRERRRERRQRKARSERRQREEKEDAVKREVDRILSKISRVGMGGLTKKETAFLKEASRLFRDRTGSGS